MKKNVFQGFENSEVKNLELFNGGIKYQVTGGKANDEEAVTAKGEADPWNGDTGNYDRIDARWENCKP